MGAFAHVPMKIDDVTITPTYLSFGVPLALAIRPDDAVIGLRRQNLFKLRAGLAVPRAHQRPSGRVCGSTPRTRSAAKRRAAAWVLRLILGCRCPGESRATSASA